MLKKYISILCILVGVILVLYPTIKDKYESYEQRQILKEWEENLQQIEEVSPDAAIDDTEVQQDNLVEDESPAGAVTDQPIIKPLKIEKTAAEKYIEKHVEGVLMIEKIDLKLPILTNATKKNLSFSVASIAKTGKAGAVGNYAIAGHRNYSYGKNFNRLDELAVGDLIDVDTGGKQYWYKVSEKKYVLPTAIEVLEGNGKDREITLITCHPMKNPTHRLIIKGILFDKNS